MATQIQFKRGLNAAFPPIVLKAGEPAFVTDKGKLYIGDGVNKILINPIEKPVGLDTTTAYSKVKVNDYGQVVTLSNITTADLPPINVSNITGLGTAAVANTGTSNGNVPVLDGDGKLAVSTIPAVAITDVFVVASQGDMLALNAQVGDIAVRTDVSQTFILKTAPASALANWVQLLQPTDAVASVNGKTGVVVLIPSDIVMTGYVKAASYSPIVTTDNLSVALGKLEKNFDNYAQLNSPTFTGTPKSTTPTVGDNSTNIATTAFVTNALNVVDGGTF